MKAVIVTKYGSPEVLQIKEIPFPVVKDNEALIKIKAAAVVATDPVFRKGEPFISRIFSGLFKPKYPIPGDLFAGVVEEIGKDVKNFKKGDRVLGTTAISFGAHAEYKLIPEDGAIAHLPESIEFGEAMGICDGALTALPFLRDNGKIKSGDEVVIYGASGSVGTAAVQIAKYFGANVTAICSSANFEMVKSLGADDVIDYTKEDFTKMNNKYDIIFDAVGKLTFKICKKSLKESGIYLTTVPSAGLMLSKINPFKKKGRRADFAATGLRQAKEKVKDINILVQMAVSGKLITVIDREYSLDDISEAHRYVECGHKKGNVILRIS